MRSTILILAITLPLSACDLNPTGSKSNEAERRDAAVVQSAPDSVADPFAAHDPAEGHPMDPALADDQPRPVMYAQVVLDRLGFTPGVVDGKEGMSTRNAIMGFQEARDLPVTGLLDAETNSALARWSNIPATRIITIHPDFASDQFRMLPAGPAEQAKLTVLGYETLDEKLAERFHTTVETLVALNPNGSPSGLSSVGVPSANRSHPTPRAAPSSGSKESPQSIFSAGQKIRVPNVGADRIETGSVKDAAWQKTLAMLGVGSRQPQAAKIIVSKSKGSLKVFDASDQLIAVFTATMGSEHDPLPLGRWKVNGTSRNPTFHYNPALFWDASSSAKKATLPPGPNGPVGVVWIDLNKPHYGIHGTPHPETIGRAESHGCVRLTNWDAARLAQMVTAGTQVLFEA